MSKRSEVWNYFKKEEKNKDEAMCNICLKIIGCKGSSTSPLLNHLKVHKIIIKKTSTDINENQDKIASSSSTLKKPKIDSCDISKFLKKESLEEILARCVAHDGISIHAVTKSRAIIGYVQSKGYLMPNSATTVTKHIINYYNNKKKDLITKIFNLKKNNVKFSLTVDEWTDSSMNRYLNISLHFLEDEEIKTFEVYVLGLVQIKGSCNAEQTKIYVEEKLNEFNVNPKTDIISSTHDGAAVMVKYGKILDAIPQLCQNHALHLAVTDTFYKKNAIYVNEVNNSDNSDSEDLEVLHIDTELENEDETSYDNFILNNDANIGYEPAEETENNLSLNNEYEIKPILNKIRNVIKMIKASSIKNSILQDHVIKQEGKPLALLLDVKIRWNSIITMVRRFLLIKNCVNQTLQELGMPTISEEEMRILQDILEVLSPMEVAIKELSKNSATLLTAEGVFKFVFLKMEEINTALSQALLRQLKKRMNERRDKTLLTLMILLETGSIPQYSEYFEYSSKSAAITLAIQIMERIYPNGYTNVSSEVVADENELEISTNTNTTEENLNLLQKQLGDAISSITYVNPTSSGSGIQAGLKKDFQLLASTKRRSNNLIVLFNALLTIKPTSTATERVFSTAGKIKTKLRTKLNFETFDALIFLKYAFLKMK